MVARNGIKLIGGINDDYLRVLKSTLNGGYILNGSAYPLLKLNSLGNTEWVKTGGGFTCLDQTKDGGYILGTNSSADIGGDKTENSRGGTDYWVVKLSAYISLERTIQTQPLNSPGFCPLFSEPIPVSFTTTGTYSPNEIFIAQLSDELGSFASPVNIGTGSSSPIITKLPFNTLPGNGFRIRVVSSLAPVVTGADNGNNIKISSNIILGAYPQIYGPGNPCPGTSVEYETWWYNVAKEFIWEVPADWVITKGQGTDRITVTVGKSTGMVTVLANDYCDYSTLGELPVQPVSFPAPPIITASAAEVCAGHILNFSTTQTFAGGQYN